MVLQRPTPFINTGHFRRKTSGTGIFVLPEQKGLFPESCNVTYTPFHYGNKLEKLDRFKLGLWLAQSVFVFLRIKTYRIPQLEWTVSRSTTMERWLALILNTSDVPMPISEERSTVSVSETICVWKKMFFIFFSCSK